MQGPRRAAVSAFGFGGNNAHLVVEEHQPGQPVSVSVSAPRGPIAIVGLGAQVGPGEGRASLEAALFGPSMPAPAQVVRTGLKGLRFPPKDLEQTLSQQVMVLQAAREATQGLELPRDGTAVLVGMGCDANVARYGARWRLADWAEALGRDAAWLAEAREGFVPLLKSAGVVGTMPNIPANRLNSPVRLRRARASHVLARRNSPACARSRPRSAALRAGELRRGRGRRRSICRCEPVHRAALATLVNRQGGPGRRGGGARAEAPRGRAEPRASPVLAVVGRRGPRRERRGLAPRAVRFRADARHGSRPRRVSGLAARWPAAVALPARAAAAFGRSVASRRRARRRRSRPGRTVTHVRCGRTNPPRSLPRRATGTAPRCGSSGPILAVRAAASRPIAASGGAAGHGPELPTTGDSVHRGRSRAASRSWPLRSNSALPIDGPRHATHGSRFPNSRP